MVLIAFACLVGIIAGLRSRAPRGTLLRPFKKPMKAPPCVLVPPGAAPRLIPSDSPKATRARSKSTLAPRQTPDGIPSSGVVDYIAVFADSPRGAGNVRVDYLLEAGDEQGADEPLPR